LDGLALTKKADFLNFYTPRKKYFEVGIRCLPEIRIRRLIGSWLNLDNQLGDKMEF
jgi:hypothetical protein